MRIAIVGSGIAGLTAAHHLHRRHDIVLYEAEERLGGHTHTHTIDLDDGAVSVDSGFIVYNEANYPNFSALLSELGVATQPSRMTFSVSCAATGLEWAGGSPSAVLAQPSNLARAGFVRMLADIVRFNRRARRFLAEPWAGDDHTVAEFLADGRWSQGFRDNYLLPLGSAVWSCDPSTFESFPTRALFGFMRNHDLLKVGPRQSWRTVSGGSARYVEALVAPFADRVRLGTPVRALHRDGRGVDVAADSGLERFDHVVVATHSDQALELLTDATPTEKEVLGAIEYRVNDATLHTDERMLPRARRAWASWNYRRPLLPSPHVQITYHLNQLQRLTTRHQVCVSLNSDDEVEPDRVLARMRYAHPVYDAAVFAAQRRRAEVCGVDRTWYCGAYWGYGFHEDGVVSALDVCRRLEAGAA